jgi:hypothetical protein
MEVVIESHHWEMVETKNAHSLRAPWLTPGRMGVVVLVMASVILSPLLVVYEFVLGLALVISGYIARFARPNSPAVTHIRTIGLVLLAGPLAYTIAWPLGIWLNW